MSLCRIGCLFLSIVVEKAREFRYCWQYSIIVVAPELTRFSMSLESYASRFRKMNYVAAVSIVFDREAITHR